MLTRSFAGALCALALIAPSAVAAPGDLDPSFGSGGRQTVGFDTPAAFAEAVLVHSSGRIVAGGNAGSNWALAGFRAQDGALDPAFGSGGKAQTSWTAGSLTALAEQADGKIVAVGGAAREGGTPPFEHQFALARYNPDGTPDTSFGGDGKVRFGYGEGQHAVATDVAVQPDGKLVAVGSVMGGNFAVARFNSDGSVDTTFGDGGRKTFSAGGAPEEARAVALASDGKIVLGGYATTGGVQKFAVARLSSAGQLDSGFGTNGVTVTSMGSNDTGQDVAVDSAGRILLAGHTSSDGSERFALARYTDAGGLDPDFGPGGGVVTAFENANVRANAMVVQPNGRIVLAGHSTAADGASVFALARFMPDGPLDTTFGTGGRVVTDFPSTADDYASAAALQGDGKLVAAGSADVTGDFASSVAFALARYDATSPQPAGEEREPSFYEQIFSLRDFKLVPDARFPLVLDYMPYRGKQVRRGLWDAKKTPREDFPRYSAADKRRLARGTLPKSRRINFWNVTDVQQAIEILRNRRIYVQLTLKPRPREAVADIWKPYVKPGEVFAQEPRPQHQPGRFTSSAADPPQLVVSYWDPARDPKKADPPPQLTKAENPCRQLKALLVPERGGSLPFEASTLDLLNNYATRKPPCFASLKWAGDPNIDQARITRAEVGPGGDDASQLDVTVTEPRPTKKQDRVDVVDLALTATPLPVLSANQGPGFPTLDGDWRLTAGTRNGLRMQVKDLSIGLNADRSMAGPFGGATLQVWFDPAGGGQDYEALRVRVNNQERADVETGQAGSKEAGQATLVFDVPDREGTIQVRGFAYPRRGEPLDGWMSFPVVKRNRCFVAQNGWSYKPNARNAIGWDVLSRCGGGRVRASSHGELHNPFLSAYCFLLCPFNPGLKDQLLRQEGDPAAAVRTRNGTSSNCSRTVPAVTAVGAAVPKEPAPGAVRSTEVTLVAFGGLLGATSQTGLDLGSDGVALTAVSGCANLTKPIDVTKSESIAVAEVISTGGGNLIGQAGGNVISTGGGNVISTGGGNVIATGGGNLISDKGLGLIGQAGGNVISTGGGNVISTGGGNF